MHCVDMYGELERVAHTKVVPLVLKFLTVLSYFCTLIVSSSLLKRLPSLAVCYRPTIITIIGPPQGNLSSSQGFLASNLSSARGDASNNVKKLRYASSMYIWSSNFVRALHSIHRGLHARNDDNHGRDPECISLYVHKRSVIKPLYREVNSPGTPIKGIFLNESIFNKTSVCACGILHFYCLC